MEGKEKLSSCTRLLRLVPALLEGVILKYILKCLISTDKASDSMFKVGGLFKVGLCSESVETDLIPSEDLNFQFKMSRYITDHFNKEQAQATALTWKPEHRGAHCSLN